MKDRNQEVVERTIEDISKLIINQRFQAACGRYFTLLTGWKKESIAHMLSYTTQAYRWYSSRKHKKEAQEEKKDE